MANSKKAAAKKTTPVKKSAKKRGKQKGPVIEGIVMRTETGELTIVGLDPSEWHL